MDLMSILVPILIAALVVLVVVVVLLIVKLMKTVNIANDTITNLTAQLEPTLENAKVMTTDLQPTVRKIEPIVDRVQLTLDAVNLEMMRVDEILEDVAQITDSASSATAAVDHIANAPAKAVTGAATRLRERFGTKSASGESTKLGETHAEIEKALEEYQAAAERDHQEAEEKEQKMKTAASSLADEVLGTIEEDVQEPEAAPEPEPEVEPAAEQADPAAPEPEQTEAVPAEDDEPEFALSGAHAKGKAEPYMVIDPKALETSPFFEEGEDVK